MRNLASAEPGRRRGRAARRALIASLAVAALVVAAPAAGVAATTTLRGVDVSAWQPGTNWASVARSGIRFAFIKATEGPAYVNPYYASDRAGAGAAGIRIGAYDFARPRGATVALATAAGRAQADRFVSVARPRAGDIAPTLDMEETGGLPPTRLTAWTRGWIDEVTARVGVHPIVYTSPLFWQLRLANTREFALDGVRLWIANWGVSQPAVPAANWAGQGWTFWQWTDASGVPGIGGRVDADRTARLVSALIPAPPTVLDPAGVSGTARVGRIVTAAAGVWAGTRPMTFAYQWLRCNRGGTSCIAIPGATKATHVVAPADAWSTLRVLVRSRNTAGRARSRSAASTRVPDTVAPTAPVFGAPLRAMQVGTVYHVAWHATDVGSGVASYTVHVRTAGPSGSFGRARSAAASTGSTSIAGHGAPGTTSCYRAQARDRVGNVGPWSAPRCTAVPLDDTAFHAETGWWARKHGQPGAYDGTILETRSNGSRTTTGVIAARRLGLIVTECRACGHVAVYWNGSRIGDYDLSATRTSVRRLVRLPAFPRLEHGRLVVRAELSRGQSVMIDGLAASAA